MRAFVTTSLGMRMLPFTLLGLLILAGACADKNKMDVAHRDTDRNTVPTMMTRDVTTMISDSGITRYRITTPLWLVYDEADTPKWRFPEGLFLERFTPQFTLDATVRCDSAVYFSKDGLWRLDGNVNILNSLDEKFLTQQLFWHQRHNRIYSDSFIHIERGGRIIEGYGFESNDRMTRYSVTRPSGIFPASDFTPGARDATPSDSVSASADSVGMSASASIDR